MSRVYFMREAMLEKPEAKKEEEIDVVSELKEIVLLLDRALEMIDLQECSGLHEKFRKMAEKQIYLAEITVEYLLFLKMKEKK